MSLRLPPVSETASGVPRPQAIRWCLEPLLERSTGLGPVFAPPQTPARANCRSLPATSRSGRPRAASPAPARAVAARPPPPATRVSVASRSSPSRNPSPAAGTPTGSPSATRTRSRSAPCGRRAADDRGSDNAASPLRLILSAEVDAASFRRRPACPCFSLGAFSEPCPKRKASVVPKEKRPLFFCGGAGVYTPRHMALISLYRRWQQRRRERIAEEYGHLSDHERAELERLR